MQQEINRTYRPYTGIIPADGIYSREMNTALIQILQAIEGFTPAEATGNFGDGTRSRLITVTPGNAAANPDWVWLATIALTCYDYGDTVSRTWHAGLTEQVRSFQRDYALPVTGTVDPTTWMSLLTSKGDPDRAAIACDTRFEITDELLGHLQADGFEIVGRYLTEPGQEETDPEDYFKAIRPGELERIIAGGMKFFPIYQYQSTSLGHFTPEEGVAHARDATAAALRLRIPPTHIYFAVDFDATDPQVTSHIIPYFRAVHEQLGSGYRVGIYGARNICTRVIEAGYASSAFVSDMSTGFSGNLGFPLPDAWNYDQFHEVHGYAGGGWDLDKVAASGRHPAVDRLLPGSPPETSDPLVEWVSNTEDAWTQEAADLPVLVGAYASFGYEFILEWMRRPTYWGSPLWMAYTPELAIPAELGSARRYCHNLCDTQPPIKGTIVERDIEHFAATALGYLNWGTDGAQNACNFGDLGGWALDMLQLWGTYSREAGSSPLEFWMDSNLGALGADTGFDYDDFFADAEAYLTITSMDRIGSGNSAKRLSTALEDVYSVTAAARISRFYQERFSSDAKNVEEAFVALSQGLVFGEANVPIPEFLLLEAADAEGMPTEAEARIMGRVYANKLAYPLTD